MCIVAENAGDSDADTYSDDITEYYQPIFANADDEDGDEDLNEETRMKRRRAESDSAMRRAFEEDDSRRNEPLTAENAMRVVEAMRGVSFEGFAPDWVRRIPEDQWVDHLRRLRQFPHFLLRPYGEEIDTFGDAIWYYVLETNFKLFNQLLHGNEVLGF
ncbi:hypothetical protein Ancab_011733 [Ancistrocladus abbreviatus]